MIVSSMTMFVTMKITGWTSSFSSVKMFHSHLQESLFVQNNALFHLVSLKHVEQRGDNLEVTIMFYETTEVIDI